MKFGNVVQWVQSPSGQSVADGPEARLAVVPVTGRLMRSQASESAVGSKPRNTETSGAQDFTGSESSTLEGDRASRRGTGGVEDYGGLEEDHQVTWETLELPRGNGVGSPDNKPDALEVRWALLPANQEQSALVEVGTPREDRRRSAGMGSGPTAVWPTRQGSPMAAYERGR
jgi:hypothetical protein